MLIRLHKFNSIQRIKYVSYLVLFVFLFINIPFLEVSAAPTGIPVVNSCSAYNGYRTASYWTGSTVRYYFVRSTDYARFDCNITNLTTKAVSGYNIYFYNGVSEQLVASNQLTSSGGLYIAQFDLGASSTITNNGYVRIVPYNELGTGSSYYINGLTLVGSAFNYDNLAANITVNVSSGTGSNVNMSLSSPYSYAFNFVGYSIDNVNWTQYTGGTVSVPSGNIYFWVRLLPYTGGDAWGAKFSKNLVSPPNTPNSVTFGTVTNNSIVVNWGSVANATGYELYRDGTKVYDGADLTYIDTGRIVGTSYSYRVLAKNTSGNSSQSMAASKSTLANIPSDITFSNILDKSLTLTFNTNNNPSNIQYYVERDINSNFINSAVVQNWNTNISITDTSLDMGITYYYRVKARNGDNVETGYSTYNSQKTSTPPIATNVTLNGELKVGKILMTGYNYSDVDNDSELGTVYKWYRDGELFATNTSKIYVLKEEDKFKNISVGVVPKSNRIGESVGLEVNSVNYYIVPSVGQLEILIKDTEGNILEGASVVN